MQLYPSIDLREGRVVRLLRGDYDAETRYDQDPVAVARGFEQAGAQWVHVVDLDAARDGGAPNLAIIERICAAIGCAVQSGGGVRSLQDAYDRYAAGVARVVVGSAAVERPELVDELCEARPGQVAVGLDARGRDVAIHGWTESTGADLLSLTARFSRPGIGAIVVTSIAVDGTFTGPDVKQLHDVLGVATVPVVASGGVGTLDDLRTLAALEAGGRRLAGAIVGRALIEGRFSAKEGVEACSGSA